MALLRLVSAGHSESSGPPEDAGLLQTSASCELVRSASVQVASRGAHFARRLGLGLATAVALSGPMVACSGGDGERLEFNSAEGADPAGYRSSEAPPERGEELTPYAHVDVRVTQRVDGANSEVLAHFVYSSERVYSDAITSLNRPDQVLPSAGRCIVMGPPQNVASAEPSALLEAGTVTLRAVPADPQESLVEVSLAPRAFPGVSTLSPGVVYTSRDRQPLLPTGGTYEVNVQGGMEVPAMKLRGVAPGQLTSVTVAGTPLGQVTELVWGQPVDITWDVGSNNAATKDADLVYIDVTNKLAGQGLLRCAYLDVAGTGTLPWTDALAQGLTENGQATLNVHRHRRVISTNSDATAQGELRFDFELTRDVNFVTAIPNP